MPLWYIGARRILRADAATALRQLNECATSYEVEGARIEERRRFWTKLHRKRAAELRKLEADPSMLTGEILTAAIR